MLKTQRDGRVWCITQPDHAQISGYLAAHWGNREFTQPGLFVPVPDAERLRAEVVTAVAQHDNGWWEWESSPDISPADGFPAGLTEVLQNQQVGMDRWRNGLARFPDRPYVNLLISFHAYRLYAAKDRPSADPAFQHTLFWQRDAKELMIGANEEESAFMAELEAMQRGWMDELRADGATASWVEPESLYPHARLLQLLDGLSLSLCSDLISGRDGAARGLGRDAFELQHCPQRSWDDLVTINVTPLADGSISLDPYPFDVDPLPIFVPARVFNLADDRSGEFETWWHAQPVELLEFEYCG